MSNPWDTDPKDTAALRSWLTRWQELIRAVDFVPARPMFDPHVLGFGTYADIVEGQQTLEYQQWRKIWPTMDEYAWSLDRMRCATSADGSMAVTAVPWTSTGYDEKGGTFPRNGRCTIAFRRAEDGEWKGIHTHLSLNRGTPTASHGNKPARS